MANASGAARKKAVRRDSKGTTAPATAQAASIDGTVASGKSEQSGADNKKSAKSAASHEPSAGIKGRIAEISKFLKLVRTEMDRVSWPSWKELRAATIVVVVTLLLVSGYMGIVDWLLTLVFGTPVATGY